MDNRCQQDSLHNGTITKDSHNAFKWHIDGQRQASDIDADYEIHGESYDSSFIIEDKVDTNISFKIADPVDDIARNSDNNTFKERRTRTLQGRHGEGLSEYESHISNSIGDYDEYETKEAVIQDIEKMIERRNNKKINFYGGKVMDAGYSKESNTLKLDQILGIIQSSYKELMHVEEPYEMSARVEVYGYKQSSDAEHSKLSTDIDDDEISTPHQIERFYRMAGQGSISANQSPMAKNKCSLTVFDRNSQTKSIHGHGFSSYLDNKTTSDSQVKIPRINGQSSHVNMERTVYGTHPKDHHGTMIPLKGPGSQSQIQPNSSELKTKNLLDSNPDES